MADFGKYDKNRKGMDFEQFRSKLDSDEVQKNESLKKFFGIFDTENRNGVIDTDAERNSLFSKVKYYAGEDGILQDSEITEMLNSEPDMHALKNDTKVFNAIKDFFGSFNKEKTVENSSLVESEKTSQSKKIIKNDDGSITSLEVTSDGVLSKTVKDGRTQSYVYYATNSISDVEEKKARKSIEGIITQNNILEETVYDKSENPSAKFVQLYVNEGDTLSKIATLCGTTVEVIQQNNKMGSDTALSLGQKLIIPVDKSFDFSKLKSRKTVSDDYNGKLEQALKNLYSTPIKTEKTEGKTFKTLEEAARHVLELRGNKKPTQKEISICAKELMFLNGEGEDISSLTKSALAKINSGNLLYLGNQTEDKRLLIACGFSETAENAEFYQKYYAIIDGINTQIDELSEIVLSEIDEGSSNTGNLTAQRDNTSQNVSLSKDLYRADVENNAKNEIRNLEEIRLKLHNVIKDCYDKGIKDTEKIKSAILRECGINLFDEEDADKAQNQIYQDFCVNILTSVAQMRVSNKEGVHDTLLATMSDDVANLMKLLGATNIATTQDLVDLYQKDADFFKSLSSENMNFEDFKQVFKALFKENLDTQKLDEFMEYCQKSDISFTDKEFKEKFKEVFNDDFLQECLKENTVDKVFTTAFNIVLTLTLLKGFSNTTEMQTLMTNAKDVLQNTLKLSDNLTKLGLSVTGGAATMSATTLTEETLLAMLKQDASLAENIPEDVLKSAGFGAFAGAVNTVLVEPLCTGKTVETVYKTLDKVITKKMSLAEFTVMWEKASAPVIKSGALQKAYSMAVNTTAFTAYNVAGDVINDLFVSQEGNIAKYGVAKYLGQSFVENLKGVLSFEGVSALISFMATGKIAASKANELTSMKDVVDCYSSIKQCTIEPNPNCQEGQAKTYILTSPSGQTMLVTAQQATNYTAFLMQAEGCYRLAEDINGQINNVTDTELQQQYRQQLDEIWHRPLDSTTIEALNDLYNSISLSGKNESVQTAVSVKGQKVLTDLSPQKYELTLPENFPEKIENKNGIELKFEHGQYIIYADGNEVGYCTMYDGKSIDVVECHDDAPESWNENGKTKPYLEVTSIFIPHVGKGSGYGRKTMQAIYELSKELGYEGRVHVDQFDEANGFYTKLGFSGDGTISRYFTPTEESLSKLYKKEDNTSVIVQKDKSLTTPQGMTVEEISALEKARSENPADVVEGKIRDKWATRGLEETVEDEQVDLSNLRKTDLVAEALKPSTQTDFDEVTSLIFKGKLKETLTQRYDRMYDVCQKIAQKHEKDIQTLADKYAQNQTVQGQQEFAEGVIKILAKELDMEGFEPPVELSQLGESDGAADWYNGKIQINESIKEPVKLVRILSHEFTHMLQFRDLLAQYGEEGIRECIMNDKSLPEDSKESLIQIALTNDYNRLLLDCFEFAPVEDNSVDGYIRSIYKDEFTNIKGTDDEEYTDQVVEREAYRFGSDGVGRNLYVCFAPKQKNNVSVQDLIAAFKNRITGSASKEHEEVVIKTELPVLTDEEITQIKAKNPNVQESSDGTVYEIYENGEIMRFGRRKSLAAIPQGKVADNVTAEQTADELRSETSDATATDKKQESRDYILKKIGDNAEQKTNLDLLLNEGYNIGLLVDTTEILKIPTNELQQLIDVAKNNGYEISDLSHLQFVLSNTNPKYNKFDKVIELLNTRNGDRKIPLVDIAEIVNTGLDKEPEKLKTLFEYTNIEELGNSQMKLSDANNLNYVLRDNSPEMVEKVKDILKMTPEQLKNRQGNPLDWKTVVELVKMDLTTEQLQVIKDNLSDASLYNTTWIAGFNDAVNLRLMKTLNFDMESIKKLREVRSNETFKNLDMRDIPDDKLQFFLDNIESFGLIKENVNLDMQTIIKKYVDCLDKAIEYINIAGDNKDLLKQIPTDIIKNDKLMDRLKQELEINPNITYDEFVLSIETDRLKCIKNTKLYEMGLTAAKKHIGFNIELASEISDKLRNVDDEVINKEVETMLTELQEYINNGVYVGDDSLKLIEQYLDMYHTLVGDYEYIGSKDFFGQYDTYKRELMSYVDNDMKEYLIDNAYDNPKENSKPSVTDFVNEAKIDRLRDFIKSNPKDKIAQHLYDNYYLKIAADSANTDLINYCKKFDSEYGIKVFLSADLDGVNEAIEYLDKELAEWRRCGGDKVKFPPVLDFTKVKRNYCDKKSAYGQGAASGFSESSESGSISIDGFSQVIYIFRHEMTHTNTTECYNIGTKYNLEEIMPKKPFVDKNGEQVYDDNGQAVKAPDFENCQFIEEFLKAGIPLKDIEYAYNNTDEFIAVASEGDMSKYSPEFKKMLVDFGMPEWELDMKCLNPKTLQQAELCEYLNEFANKNMELKDASGNVVAVDKNYKAYMSVRDLYVAFAKLSYNVTREMGRPELHNPMLLFESYWNKCNVDEILNGDASSIGGWNKIFEILEANAPKFETAIPDTIEGQFVIKDSNDPFNLKLLFPEEQLELTPEQLLVKEGDKYVLTAEGAKLVRSVAEQVRGMSLAQEDDIVKDMQEFGLLDDNPKGHRSKSVQSIYDKIQNALIDAQDDIQKGKIDSYTLNDAVTKGVLDGVATRKISKVSDIASSPEVQKILATGDKKSAIDKAVEIESEELFNTLKKYIDAVHDNTIDWRIEDISNYVGPDGIPYLTEHQINWLKNYAFSKDVEMPLKERVSSLAEMPENDVVTNSDKKATTKIRNVGYTATQFKIKTKDGFIFEYQYRGELVNNFAEVEHLLYDIRTNKDIIGGNTNLSGLYKPLIDVVSNLKPDEYKEHTNYLAKYYEHLRLEELGFETSETRPKLPKGFNPILRAENLELLHDKAEKTKKEPSKKEIYLEEYKKELIQNSDENVEETSYTQKAEEADENRVITRYEASLRVGEDNNMKNNKYSSVVIKACRNENGEISAKYVAKAEELIKLGVSDKLVAELLLKSRDGDIDFIIHFMQQDISKGWKPDDSAKFTSAVIKDGKINRNLLKLADECNVKYRMHINCITKICEKLGDNYSPETVEKLGNLYTHFAASKQGMMKNANSFNDIVDNLFTRDGNLDSNAVSLAKNLCYMNTNLADAKIMLQLAKSSIGSVSPYFVNLTAQIYKPLIEQSQEDAKIGQNDTQLINYTLLEIVKSLRLYDKNTKGMGISEDSVKLFIQVLNSVPGENFTDRCLKAASILTTTKVRSNTQRIETEYNLLNVKYFVRLARQKYSATSMDSIEYLYKNCKNINVAEKLNDIYDSITDKDEIKNIDLKTENGIIQYIVEYNDGKIIVKDYDITDLTTVVGEYDITKSGKSKKYAQQVELDDNKRGIRTRLKKVIDKKARKYKLEKTTVTKDTATGETIGIEYMRESEIADVFDISYRDVKTGETKQLSHGYIQEDGTKVVEKDYESLDGTRTQYEYEETPNGNYSSNYKITDASGNVQLDERRTFVVLSDRHFVSTCNEDSWDMEIDLDNRLTVTNDKGESVHFDLDEFTKNNMNLEEMRNIISKLPGQDYFYMSRSGLKSIAPDNIYNNANYSPISNDIHLGYGERTLPTTLHEEGHGKDWNIGKISNSTTDVKPLRFDTNLMAIYKEECTAFITAFPKLEKEFTTYFTDISLGNDRQNQGLAEVIAEANMLLNQATGQNSQRSEILRRYFPKTIAYVAKKINPDVYNK